MSKKATFCIIAILMGSGLLAAYHSDNQSSARNNVQQIQYQNKSTSDTEKKLVLESDMNNFLSYNIV